jgi:hypothetical protein
MNKATKNIVNAVLDRYTLANITGMGYQVPAEETPLCKIAFKYRSDKCEKIKHPFTSFYYDLLGPQRWSIAKVLEIGVKMKRPGAHYEHITGASLYMWKDFLPFAKIYGADADPAVMFQDGRIKTVLADQSKKKDLTNLIETTGANIDLLIYDGSRLPQDQISTCLTLMPLLKKDVVYVIEDVVDLNIQKKLRQFDTRLISLRASNGRRYVDNNLLVVRNAASWA